MSENEGSIVSYDGRFRAQQCVDLQSCMLYFGTFRISLIYLF